MIFFFKEYGLNFIPFSLTNRINDKQNTKKILDITDKNPEIFLDKEVEIRKKNNLPPFQRFISLILTGENENNLEKEAVKFKLFLQNKIYGKIK